MAVVPPPLAIRAFNFLSSSLPQLRHGRTCQLPDAPLGRSFSNAFIGIFRCCACQPAAAPAFAQSAVPLNQQGVPPGANPATGARPGNDIGTGMSTADGHAREQYRRVRHTLADRTEPAEPACGAGRESADYLRAAQASLPAGRTGEAQQSLEMAQTRLLDRSVVMGQTDNPSDNPAVSQISQALKALAHGDRAQTMQLIQSTIPIATASAH